MTTDRKPLSPDDQSRLTAACDAEGLDDNARLLAQQLAEQYGVDWMIGEQMPYWRKLAAEAQAD